MKATLLVDADLQQLVSSWDIGASGAHTKTANIPGRGFTSVARTAAGKYTITFALGVPIGGLVDLELTQFGVADGEPKILRPTLSSYTAESGTTAATVKYEAWSLTAPAKTEIPSGDKVVIKATFQKTR